MSGHERIELTDSLLDIVTKLSEGNPGAMTVIMNCVESSPQIDPQCALGPLGPILSLDSLGIYAEKIWMLFKGVCEQDIVRFLGVLRAWQMGIVSKEEIFRSLEVRGSLDINKVMIELKHQLPTFRWGDDTQGNDGVTANLE